MGYSVNTNDSVRFVATFTDWAPDGDTGPLYDPDTVTVNILVAENSERDEPILTTDAVRETAGVYVYDWATPQRAGDYVVEFIGTKNGLPVTRRHSVSVRYQIDE